MSNPQELFHQSFDPWFWENERPIKKLFILQCFGGICDDLVENGCPVYEAFHMEQWCLYWGTKIDGQPTFTQLK